MTHYEVPEAEKPSRVAVNARMLPTGDYQHLPVRTFDGAKTWRYID